MAREQEWPEGTGGQEREPGSSPHLFLVLGDCRECRHTHHSAALLAKAQTPAHLELATCFTRVANQEARAGNDFQTP